MNNNEIISNNEIINNATTMSNITYTVLVADKSGHTTNADLDIDTAIETITGLVETKKNWVFINGAPFEFVGSNVRSAENASKLRTSLEQNPMAQIMLTGRVVGGAK